MTTLKAYRPCDCFDCRLGVFVVSSPAMNTAYRRRAVGALLLVCATVFSIAAAADDEIGTVLFSRIQLRDKVNPNVVLTNFDYESADWLLSPAERPASISLPWSNKWKDAVVAFCWSRRDQNTWDNDGINALSPTYPVSTAPGPAAFNKGNVTIQAMFRGDPMRLEFNGVLTWDDGEVGEKCLRVMMPETDADVDASAVCMSASFDVYAAGAALQWAIKHDALPSAFSFDGPLPLQQAMSHDQILLGFTSLDISLTPVDWDDTAEFVDAQTLFNTGDAGLYPNGVGIKETNAYFMMKFVRHCPSSGVLDGTEASNFFPSAPSFSYYLKWDPAYAPGPSGIDCAIASGDYDCQCADGTCSVKLEEMPQSLPSGEDWRTTASLNPGTYVPYTATKGFEISWTASECGPAHAKMYRLALFTEDNQVTHSHYGKLDMSQASPASNNCQSTIGSYNTHQTFLVMEDKYDANRPAQTGSASGDATGRTSGVSFDAANRIYGFRVGGRIFTDQEYDQQKFQIFTTIVGMGSGYAPDADGGQAYDFSALVDGVTKRVCVNWPEDYWTAGSFAQSSYVPSNYQEKLNYFHTMLFNSYKLPSQLALENIYTHTPNSLTAAYPSYLGTEQFRLTPIRMVSGNVVKDMFITKTGDGRYYGDWQFEGTMDDFVNCVAPTKTGHINADERASVVFDINNGVLTSDNNNGNLGYSLPVFIKQLTYRGERTGGDAGQFLWALSNDDTTHHFVYTMTINAETGAMATGRAESVVVVPELRWAKYSAADPVSCLGDATSVGLDAGFSCLGNDNDMPRQLHIRARLAIKRTDANDVGLTFETGNYQPDNEIALSYVNGNYEIVSVSYGADPTDTDSEETTTISGELYNIFYIEFKTAAISVYNHNEGVIRTDAFASGSNNPNSFNLMISLQRIKNNFGIGQWTNEYTKGTGGVFDATEFDSHYTLQLNIIFDVAPVVTMTDQKFAHGFDIEIAAFADARAGEGCTSGNQCAPFTQEQRMALPREGHITFMARPTDGLPNSVTGHLRDFRVCIIQQRSPWSGCVGTSADPAAIHDCTGRGMWNNITHTLFVDAYTKASGNTFNGGALGNYALEDKCDPGLWAAFIREQQTSPAVSWAQASNLAEYDPDGVGGHDAVLLNPIVAEYIYVQNYLSSDVSDNNEQTVPGSSTVCRGDDGGKENSIFTSHGAWACEENTHCPWETTWKDADVALTYGLADGVVMGTSVLPLDNPELRMEATYDLQECTTGSYRRLRATASASNLLSNEQHRANLESHLRPGVAMGQMYASVDPEHVAAMRKLSALGATAVSIGINGSMTSFRFEDITIDDGEEEQDEASDSKDDNTAVITIAIVVVVCAAVLGLVFFVRRRRAEPRYAHVPPAAVVNGGQMLYTHGVKVPQLSSE